MHIDWDLFTKDVVKADYNDAFEKLCAEHPPTLLELLSEIMLDAAKKVTLREKNMDARWYQHSKALLKPLLDDRNNVLFAVRSV